MKMRVRVVACQARNRCVRRPPGRQDGCVGGKDHSCTLGTSAREQGTLVQILESLANAFKATWPWRMRLRAAAGFRSRGAAGDLEPIRRITELALDDVILIVDDDAGAWAGLSQSFGHENGL